MDYIKYQENKEKEFENICRRCGSCCGVQDDPCRHLRSALDGKYLCAIYSQRGRMQETRSGYQFECVSIRKILHENWPGSWDCAYKKATK